MPDIPDDAHYKTVVKAIRRARLVPFLGAGVSLCDRPIDKEWSMGHSHLPSGDDLAQFLSTGFGYPLPQIKCPSCKACVPMSPDLSRVSQFVLAKAALDALYNELHEVFEPTYSPNTVHDFLATLPAFFRQKGYPVPFPLIVTTNYDDVLERSFWHQCEAFDVVSYIAQGTNCGKFLHYTFTPKNEKGEFAQPGDRLSRWPPEEVQPKLIERPNEYLEFSLDMRTVILKMHGDIDRLDPKRDSFVIAEDHFIDYLTQTDLFNFLPTTLLVKLSESNFLFLGYSLRDWNMRVILHRIWGKQMSSYKRWAIQLNPDELEKKFWEYRGVEIFDLRLEDYLKELRKHL